MANNIVTVNVSQTQAPTPSTLQRTGALISQGATNTAQGTLTLLTQASDLTPILAGGKATSSLVYSGGIVTVTFPSPHGWTVSDQIAIVVSGVAPAAFNGSFFGTIASSTTVTYSTSGVVPSPTTATQQGSVTLSDVSELVSMVTTWFAQGSSASVYVLELGEGIPSTGVALLQTYLIANPGTLYSILVPREWDANNVLLPLLASYESTTSKLYFYITSSAGTYTQYTALMKCAKVWIEAPSIPSTEFTAAADMWVNINRNPSTVNRVTPNAFAEVVGVTPYPTKGNSALLATFKAAHVNVIGTGSEGGISNAIVLWGTTMDGRDFTYWYSVDWVQINVDLDLSNEIINGSNNPINPLLYDQNGINRLQARAQETMNRGVTYGLVLPPVTVNAIPFGAYNLQNPSDYKVGAYNGLSTTYTPARGFISITFNINVTDFPTS